MRTMFSLKQQGVGKIRRKLQMLELDVADAMIEREDPQKCGKAA